MKMLFKQKIFSWFDSYDIFDENHEILYTVKGQFGWGHVLKIFDRNGNEVGMIKEKVFTWLPKFIIYKNDVEVGYIRKEFTFFKPKFTIDYNSWRVEGDFLGWDYRIYSNEKKIAKVTKQLFKLTDTYVIDVDNPSDALDALMLVLSIDVEECTRNRN